MPTNLAIDEKLLVAAQRLGGFVTKRATVNEALREFIQRREQMKMIKSFGTVEMWPDYDYKALRRRGVQKRK